MSTFQDFIETVNERGIYGSGEEKPCYAIVTYSDHFEVVLATDIVKVNVGKLLDIRTFNDRTEVRLYRDYIGNSFNQLVVISDEDEGFSDYYDDEQFLDIDRKRSLERDDGKLYATGGGVYSLPFRPTQDAKVIIRNYVDYDEDGQAFIKAWRVAGFKN